jgi:hypothetical protein
MDNKNAESEFLVSWDEIERFYDNLLSHEGWEWVKPIRSFISDLRKQGYDKKFRAGQSVWIFILSRSIEHGLREGQHSLSIQPQRTGSMILEYRAPERTTSVEVSQIVFCAELKQKLDLLEKQSIN